MTVISDWTWWTYFLVDDVLVSGGRILDHDVSRRWLRYLVENPRSKLEEYKASLWLEREGIYQRVWVDSQRRSSMYRQTIDSMLEGVTPEGFVELADGVDPRDYFGDEQIVLATYLPFRLKE
jgi:hypothetical protein